METPWEGWQNIANLQPKNYTCGYCGCKIGSNKGYHSSDASVKIYICTHCGIPSFFYSTNQYPGALLGRTVQNLPDDIEKIYTEIKNSIKNNLYTASLLLGRKLIMHLAVDKADAEEGESFVQYVEHLKSSGYIPPNGDQILKYIKDLGNEKNHEIKIGGKEEAEKILKFIEGLLIFIYEFPSEFSENEENSNNSNE